MSIRARLRARLGAKILLVMALVLVATSVLFLALLVPVYRHELLDERQAVANKLVALLHITLENAMLKRDIEGLRDIVERLGASDNIAGVMIANPAGEIRFSSRATQIGKTYAGVGALCPGCGLSGQRAEIGSAFMRGLDDREVLRAVNVVANREPCTQCHGPVAENPVNGLLVVDYAAESLKQQAARTTALLAGAGGIVLLGALGATWLMLRRFVIAPVVRLGDASRLLASGDLSARADLGNGQMRDGDEIADLGRHFDDMAARLEATVTVLRRHEAFQQALIDGIPDGVRVMDENFTVIAANAAYGRQCGVPLEQIIGRPCYASSHKRAEPCVPTLVVCPVVAMRTHAGSIKCTDTHLDGAGASLPVEISAAAIERGTGPAARRYIVESIRDLTGQAQVSQEQRLSEIGLLATGMAHEIHNPLTSIRLGIKAIQRSLGAQNIDSEIRDYIGMVDAEIDRCLEVTERLMWLSQPAGEKGGLVEIAKVARDVIALLHYEAESRKLDVVADVQDAPRIIANSSELGMILINLMQNAFHASPQGGVVKVAATAGNDGMVSLAVTDTGVGIAAEDMEKIFYPFWSRRADGSTGSGLGLAICKELVKKWGGTIRAASMPGSGATFTLTFPSAEKSVGIA